jgi:drug/metabolite transporter (DMT)-like permease
MSWLMVAIIAYLMLATVNLLDKFLVDNVLKNSRAYAFAACSLGLLIFVASPWFLSWPGWPLLVLNLVNGSVFAVALWLLYEALRRGEASRTLVLIGGATPIFSLLFSILFFQEKFSANQWAGMAFILIGVLVIAFLPVSRSYLSRVLGKFNLVQVVEDKGLLIALFSALAYSLYFVSTKYAYSFQPFISAFMWNRLGAAIFVLIFLFRNNDRRAIIGIFSRPGRKKNGFLIILNQAIGSLGFILQNYAIFLGSVVLVNALQGIQYAFLLIISASLSLLAPKLLKETFSWRIVLQKTIAVVAIAIGLYFIAF